MRGTESYHRSMGVVSAAHMGTAVQGRIGPPGAFVQWQDGGVTSRTWEFDSLTLYRSRMLRDDGASRTLDRKSTTATQLAPVFASELGLVQRELWVLVYVGSNPTDATSQSREKRKSRDYRRKVNAQKNGSLSEPRRLASSRRPRPVRQLADLFTPRMWRLRVQLPPG